MEISPFPQTLNLPVDRLKLSCESVDGVWFVFLFCFFPCVWLFAECEYIHHQRRDIFQWVVSRLLARWRGWRQDELTVQPLCYKKNPRRDACCMQQADVPVLWQTHTHTNTHTHFRTRSDRQTDAPTHTHTHLHTCTVSWEEGGGGLGRLPAGLVWGFQNHGQLTWSSSSEVSSPSVRTGCSIFVWQWEFIKEPTELCLLTVTPASFHCDRPQSWLCFTLFFFFVEVFCRPAPLASRVRRCQLPLQPGERCIWCKMWWW